MLCAAKQLELVSVADYLATEFDSETKHEYLGGKVYAVPCMTNLHNRISTNVLCVIGSQLRGKRYEPFNSATKTRIQMPTHTRFYYPDASIICQSNPETDSFQDLPVVIAEVLSRKTRRVDEGEKKDAYLTIPSLKVYLLIEQELPRVTVYRRTEQGFSAEVYDGLDAVAPLAEIEAELPLAELYERVEFVAEPDDDER